MRSFAALFVAYGFNTHINARLKQGKARKLLEKRVMTGEEKSPTSNVPPPETRTSFPLPLSYAFPPLASPFPKHASGKTQTKQPQKQNRTSTSPSSRLRLQRRTSRPRRSTSRRSSTPSARRRLARRSPTSAASSGRGCGRPRTVW